MKYFWSGVIVGVIALVVIFAVDSVHAQQPPQLPVEQKFPISEVEQLKLENIKLKAQLLTKESQQLNDASKAFNEIEVPAFNTELEKYVADTLKAHNNPDNVTFDKQSMVWRVVSPKVSGMPQQEKAPVLAKTQEPKSKQ